jgi:hypothetical protein
VPHLLRHWDSYLKFYSHPPTKIKQIKTNQPNKQKKTPWFSLALGHGAIITQMSYRVQVGCTWTLSEQDSNSRPPECWAKVLPLGHCNRFNHYNLCNSLLPCSVNQLNYIRSSQFISAYCSWVSRHLLVRSNVHVTSWVPNE